MGLQRGPGRRCLEADREAHLLPSSREARRTPAMGGTRPLEKLTGADLSKLFPAPRTPTDKIPECRPHLERGEHLKLYRFSSEDYREIVAVCNGPHPETGEDLTVVDHAPEGVPPNGLPSQPGVFAPGLRAGGDRRDRAQAARGRRLPKEPTGVVANGESDGRAGRAGSKVT